VGLLAPRPTPNLEDQVSVFETPGDRVAQLYSRALGSSDTSGVPLPVLTIVGPWGVLTYMLYTYMRACVREFYVKAQDEEEPQSLCFATYKFQQFF
jgi:hypothetical protein